MKYGLFLLEAHYLDKTLVHRSGIIAYIVETRSCKVKVDIMSDGGWSKPRQPGVDMLGQKKKTKANRTSKHIATCNLPCK